MKTYKTLIVEDEGPARRRLETLVRRHPQLEWIGSAVNGADARNAISAGRPDILLMDIQLKDQTAFEVLEAIHPPYAGKLIFITAYSEFAVKAFEVAAMDYLLKPFAEERFEQAVNRVLLAQNGGQLEVLMQQMQQLLPANAEVLRIPEGNREHRIRPEAIDYIRSEANYAYFVGPTEKRMIRITLRQLEHRLPAAFIRINKSTIVHEKAVTEMVQHRKSLRVILRDGSEFSVTSTYREGVERRLRGR